MEILQEVVVEFNPGSAEHDALQETKKYWDAKRGVRRMPARSDILPSDLKKWLPHILLVDVLSDAEDFRYRLIGTRLRPYFPFEATGLGFREALEPFGQATVEATLSVFRSVVRERAPALVKGPGLYFAQESKFFEAMLMPLGDDDDHVTMIFAAFEFEWDRPAA